MKREVIIYLGGRFIPAAVNLAVIILAIRYLGPVEYGRYSLLLYTALIAVTLSFHWIQVSILRFLGHASRETQIAMTRFYDLTWFSALTSTLIVVLTGIFYFHLPFLELILVAFFAFLTHFYLFHMAVLQVYHYSTRAAILEGSDQLLALIVLLTGLFLYGWKSATLMFLALVIGLTGVLILRLIIHAKGIGKINRGHFYWDSRFSGKVFNFGYGLALFLLFSHVIMAADRFILKEYFGYMDAGSYSAIKDLISKVVVFAGLPIYISYQSKIVDLWHAHRKEDAWASVKEAISFQLLVYILVFIVFMVIKSMLFADWLQIPAMDFWMIYLPLVLASFIWQTALLLQRFLELMFRPGFWLIAIAACALMNILLNLFLVPRYGIVASSVIMLVTSVVYGGYLFFLSCLGRKKNGNPVPRIPA
ncbi:MAG: lipopolysaccharide biosynthesis protein [Bacteroidales bacterium]|nr:lipopolysaccharide biosynthesis protein [Bacteroidales bacterium]